MMINNRAKMFSVVIALAIFLAAVALWLVVLPREIDRGNINVKLSPVYYCTGDQCITYSGGGGGATWEDSTSTKGAGGNWGATSPATTVYYGSGPKTVSGHVCCYDQGDCWMQVNKCN